MCEVPNAMNRVEDPEPERSESAVECLVIKRLLNEEIDRLEEDRVFLVGKGHYESADKVYYQILGIQTFWAKLRQEGIAL